MEIAAGAHAIVEVFADERSIAIQPPLRLEKAQEEQARDIQERHRLRVRPIDARGNRFGERANLRVERVVEPACQSASAEYLDAARVMQEIIVGAHGGERAERLGIGIDDAIRLP